MEYVTAKTIVNKTKNTAWFGTEYNMNIYRGCCHGCIYCDSRNDCYRIDSFDTVRAKEDALRIIRDDLRRKVRKGVVATGAMSDPYNPFERELELTRHALELLYSFGFGVAIDTKSDLITRDIDILKYIKKTAPTLCKITVTTADDDLCRYIEPHAPTPSSRFAALNKLSENGIYAGILLMPLLPFINDTAENVLAIVRAANENGARFIHPAFGVTLRGNQRAYFYSKLKPSTREKYIAEFGDRYNCSSPNSKALYNTFRNECERLGILYNMKDIVKSYKLGYESQQLKFFD